MTTETQLPVGALRERMIEDMRVRGMGEKTRMGYVRRVRAFTAFIGRPPDTATAEDLRRFQIKQTEDAVGVSTMNSTVSALRFLFTTTLDRPDLARRLTVVRQVRRLPQVLRWGNGLRRPRMDLRARPPLRLMVSLETASCCCARQASSRDDHGTVCRS
jgi:hypothetical protein